MSRGSAKKSNNEIQTWSFHSVYDLYVAFLFEWRGLAVRTLNVDRTLWRYWLIEVPFADTCSIKQLRIHPRVPKLCLRPDPDRNPAGNFKANNFLPQCFLTRYYAGKVKSFLLRHTKISSVVNHEEPASISNVSFGCETVTVNEAREDVRQLSCIETVVFLTCSDATTYRTQTLGSLTLVHHRGNWRIVLAHKFVRLTSFLAGCIHLSAKKMFFLVMMLLKTLLANLGRVVVLPLTFRPNKTLNFSLQCKWNFAKLTSANALK